MIRGWEAGEHGLSERYRLLYAAAFGIAVDQLFTGMAESGPVALSGAPIRAQGEDGPSHMAGGHDLSEIESLRRELNEVLCEHSLTPSSLDDWEATVMRHGQATRERPAILMLADLTADLAELRRALSGCRSSSALRRLTRVTAHMAGLMCLTLIKLDDRTAFRRWARTARIAAEEAGDPLTYSWVRAQEAYGYYYCGEPTEAISVARHAQDLAKGVPCVGSVLAAALEGRAQAALGPERAHEARLAMHRAEAILSSLDATSVASSAFGYSQAQLRFHAGNALTHLHDTAGAWQEQEQALQLYAASDYLDRTLTWLDRAYCLAHDGSTREAVSHATHALEVLAEHQCNGMIINRARQIVAVLPARQRALPPVREFRELLASSSDRGSPE
jgi:tetratricopeptide (TPR) repeat protein